MNIRPITPDDRELLANWIEKDDDHRGITAADFFYEQPTLVFEDDLGPVFFIRFSTALRLDIEFDAAQPRRTALMLPRANEWVRQHAQQRGFKQIIFSSVARSLIRFCVRRLGFRPSPDEYLSLL